MAETVSIAITGDMTGLQAAMETAADNVSAMADMFVSEFQRASEATDHLAETADQVIPALGRVGAGGVAAASDVSKLGEAAAGIAASIDSSALQAGAQAILQFGRNAFDSAVNIGREADALGVSTTVLQAYQYAAREAGVSQENAATALKTFAANVGAVQESADPAANAIKELGLTAEELRGDPLEAMETVARSWVKLNDAEEKASILRELSGRSGQDMAAMMERLAGGLDTQAEAARKAGEMLDPNLAAAAENAKTKFDDASTRLMVALTPATISAAGHITALVEAFNKLPGTIESANEAIQDTIDLDAQLLSRGMAPIGIRSTKPAEGAIPRATNPPDAGLLAMANTPMPLPAPGPPATEPQINTDSSEQEVAQAKETAARIDAIYNQMNDAIIQGEQQLDASKLKLGQENLEQFTAQELNLAHEKYEADLKAQSQSESRGTMTHAEFLAKETLLDQQYANRKAQIEEEAAEKYRQRSQQDLQNYISAEQTKLKEGMSSYDEQFRSGQISAGQREQLEDSLTSDIQKNIDDRLEFDMEALDLDSAAYEMLEKQKEKIDEEFLLRHRQITSQIARDDAAAWNEASREILSSEDTLVRDVLTKRQSLGVDLLQMVGQMAEKEIESDLRLWTQKAMIAVLGSDRIKATEQGGFLWNLIFGQQDVAQTAETETKKTAVVTAGVTAQTAEQKAGSAAGLAAQAAAGSSQILNNAYVAATGAYSALSSIPIIGPELGAVAAGATFAAVMAFDSLTSMDVGAWELPRDMPAMLHKGEMVVPQNFASGLRANGGMGGGGDGVTFNTHYYPTINMREPASLKDMLQGSGAELFDSIQRGYRTGLPMRPSMRSV